jgi:hypothetical protein
VAAEWDELSDEDKTALGEPVTDNDLQAESHMQLRLRCRALGLNFQGAEATLVRRILENQGSSPSPTAMNDSIGGGQSPGTLQLRIEELEQRLKTQEAAPVVEATDDQGAPIGTWDLSDDVVALLPTRADEAVMAAHERISVLRRYPAPRTYTFQGAKFEQHELEKLSKESKVTEKLLRDLQQRTVDAARPLLSLLNGYSDPVQPLDIDALPEEAQHALDALELVLHAAALAQRHRKELYLKALHPTLQALAKPPASRPMISQDDLDRMEKMRKEQLTQKALRQPGGQQPYGGKGPKGRGRSNWQPRGGRSKGGKGRGSWRSKGGKGQQQQNNNNNDGE